MHHKKIGAEGRYVKAAALALLAVTGSAQAEGLFDELDLSIGGFVRPEVAIQTGHENPNNQRGNPFNQENTFRQAGDPFTNYGPILPNSDFANTLRGLPIVGPIFGAIPVVNGQIPITDTSQRTGINPSNNVFNLHILRAEVEFGLKFSSDFKLVGRLRGIGESGHYSDFNGASLNGFLGGIEGGDPGLYGGAPNYFQYRVEGDKHPNPLEAAGPNYQLYFPSLFLDYNHGPLNVRLGQQQIAWGQAIFFRVLDVVNGLDLRRHSLLDYAQEEFSDKRVPSLGVRVGYQFSDSVLLDGFAQKFQPTIFGNPNTQYNVIPVQFTVHDLYAENHLDTKISYGLRLKGDFGQWGFQAIAVRRWNPDGVFRWTRSGVNKDLPNNNILGISENLLNNGVTPNPITGRIATTGELLADTPFEASPGGVYSGDEFCDYAARVRLNCVTGLNASITEFQDATTSLLAFPVNDIEAAHNELDTFFIASNGLRGHIAREYFQESVFGGGLSYVTEATPGSFLDQIVINGEISFTPNRTFTSTSLSRDFLRQDNLITALVVEKYHRFTAAFPATFFVLQYMHRTKDDLFGRSLQGYGATQDTLPKGLSGADYVVFAFQQPFPRDVYRIGFATLYDPRGGVLVQPGIQWKPNGHFSVDLFYSYLNGHLNGNPNNNVVSSIGFADEVTVRFGYQF